MGDPEEIGDSGAAASARACRVFYDALLAERFTAYEAGLLVSAWMSRSATDVAALNALFANFAETLKNGEQ